MFQLVHLFRQQPVKVFQPNEYGTVSSYQNISKTSEFDAALEASQNQPVVVFKHSRLCDLSAMAWEHMQSVQLPVYEVVVQTARPLSNHIEESLGIRHETPQVIVLHRGEPVFDTSHRGVTTDAVHEAAGRLQPAS